MEQYDSQYKSSIEDICSEKKNDFYDDLLLDTGKEDKEAVNLRLFQCKSIESLKNSKGFHELVESSEKENTNLISPGSPIVLSVISVNN